MLYSKEAYAISIPEVVREEAPLTELFAADLAIQPDMEPVVSSEGRRGALVGSAEGAVAGPHLRGRIRVTVYSGNCAYLDALAGKTPDPNQHLCTIDRGGFIETEDGAVIRLDGRGYGYRGFDPERPYLERIVETLQLVTEDERYGWLNGAFAVWVGEFDERAARAQFQAHLVGEGPPE